MKARVERCFPRCEWRGGCDSAATYAVHLDNLGPFGKYCAPHAYQVAGLVNEELKAPPSSEDK